MPFVIRLRSLSCALPKANQHLGVTFDALIDPLDYTVGPKVWRSDRADTVLIFKHWPNRFTKPRKQEQVRIGVYAASITAKAVLRTPIEEAQIETGFQF
jgi:hypothetical protein